MQTLELKRFWRQKSDKNVSATSKSKLKGSAPLEVCVTSSLKILEMGSLWR